jgi:hypothetical protein
MPLTRPYNTGIHHLAQSPQPGVTADGAAHVEKHPNLHDENLSWIARSPEVSARPHQGRLMSPQAPAVLKI